MLDFIEFISQFLKLIGTLLALGFIVVLVPAGVLLAKDEIIATLKERQSHPKRKHRRSHGADATYMIHLVQIYRENKAVSEALTFEYASESIWSI